MSTTSSRRRRRSRRGKRRRSRRGKRRRSRRRGQLVSLIEHNFFYRLLFPTLL